MKKTIKRTIVFFTVICMTFSSLSSVVHAGMIGTNDVLNLQERTVIIDKAARFLAQDKVTELLLDLGVNQQTVSERVALLTDDELMQLSENIDQAPAGAGAVEVIGILFIVLIILELVGVTDIFKKL